MSENIFRKLCEGGAFNLPYLVHLYNDDSSENVYLINDNSDFTYSGNTYKASNFTFTYNADGSSNLEVELVDSGNAIIDLFENNYNFTAEIVGVLKESGDVYVIKSFKHDYASATWNGKSASITFEGDDRLSMTFPTLVWNTYNNRGNS